MPFFSFCNILLLQASSDVATSATILVILILILLLITAIASGAETAYFSLKAKDVIYLKTKDSEGARQAMQLIDQPKLLLATLLVVDNFFNIAIIIAINLLARQLLPDLGWMLNLGLQILVISFLLIFFGNILPRVYAAQNTMRMTLFSAPLLLVLSRVFKPITRSLVSSTSYIEGRLGNKSPGNISTEDFEQAIEQTVGHSATQDEINIFKGILKFGSITARQVMHGRLDVHGIQYDLSFPLVQQYALEAGHSRMPVYKKNLDDIVGMLFTKDFLPHTEDANFDWHSLIRPAYFVHEGKLIEDLLHEFQKKRIHFAIVVDEYGGTAGTLTMEDVMEEIIGDIRDEFDEEELHFKKIDDYNFIVMGKTLINDLCRITGLSSDLFRSLRANSDTVAGLMLEVSGKFPLLNESITYGQVEFIVLEIANRRIEKVKVIINPEGLKD